MIRFNLQSLHKQRVVDDTSERSASSRCSQSSTRSFANFAKNLKVQMGDKLSSSPTRRRGMARNAMHPFKSSSPTKKYSSLDCLDSSFEDLAILLERSQEFSQEMLVDPEECRKNNASSKLDYSGVTASTCDESFSQVSFEEAEDKLATATPMGQFVVQDDTATFTSADHHPCPFTLNTNNPGNGVTMVVPCAGRAKPHVELSIVPCGSPALSRKVAPVEHNVQEEEHPDAIVVEERATKTDSLDQHLAATTSTKWSGKKNELDISCRSADSLDLSRERRQRRNQPNNKSPRRSRRRRGRRRRHSLQPRIQRHESM